jgi:hypothetical protein
MYIIVYAETEAGEDKHFKSMISNSFIFVGFMCRFLPVVDF